MQTSVNICRWTIADPCCQHGAHIEKPLWLNPKDAISVLDHWDGCARVHDWFQRHLASGAERRDVF